MGIAKRVFDSENKVVIAEKPSNNLITQILEKITQINFDAVLISEICFYSRVEQWRTAELCFHRPLIKPCVRFSLTRLSDNHSSKGIRYLSLCLQIKPPLEVLNL